MPLHIPTKYLCASLAFHNPFPFHLFQETRTLAEIAKAELDGTVLNNRPIRVRFATHGSALTVRNLLPAVTNELLEQVEWTRVNIWNL